MKYTLPAMGCWAIDGIGRHIEVIDNQNNANQYLDRSNKEIASNTSYTDKDRNRLSKQAFDNYSKMMYKDIKGPVTQAVRIEALNSTYHKSIDGVKNWWKR